MNHVSTSEELYFVNVDLNSRRRFPLGFRRSRFGKHLAGLSTEAERPSQIASLG